MSSSPPFSGLIISQQEPGTVIRDTQTGKELVVTDSNAVVKHGTVYITPKVYEQIKAQFGSPA